MNGKEIASKFTVVANEAEITLETAIASALAEAREAGRREGSRAWATWLEKINHIYCDKCGAVAPIAALADEVHALLGETTPRGTAEAERDRLREALSGLSRLDRETKREIGYAVQGLQDVGVVHAWREEWAKINAAIKAADGGAA